MKTSLVGGGVFGSYRARRGRRERGRRRRGGNRTLAVNLPPSLHALERKHTHTHTHSLLCFGAKQCKINALSSEKLTFKDEAKVGFVFSSFLFEFSRSTLNGAAVTPAVEAPECNCCTILRWNE